MSILLEARCPGKGVGSTQDPHPSLNLQVYFLTIDTWAAPNLGVLSGQKQGRSTLPTYTPHDWTGPVVHI